MVSQYMKKQYFEVIDREIEALYHVENGFEWVGGFSRLSRSIDRQFNNAKSKGDIFFMIELLQNGNYLGTEGTRRRLTDEVSVI
jgi:hypothetical protein